MAIRRRYTLLGLARPGGRPVVVDSSLPPGACLVVRVGGRPVRYRLTDTPLYGPHAGTYAADPEEGAYL